VWSIYAIILPGCKTWYFALKEEQQLKTSENKVPRITFGPEKDVTGEWKECIRRFVGCALHLTLLGW